MCIKEVFNGKFWIKIGDKIAFEIDQKDHKGIVTEISISLNVSIIEDGKKIDIKSDDVISVITDAVI